MIVSNRKQRLQLGNRRGVQTINEILVCPLSGASTRGEPYFFQGHRHGEQYAVFTKMLNHRGDDRFASISARCFFKGSIGDCTIISPTKRAKA